MLTKTNNKNSYVYKEENNEPKNSNHIGCGIMLVVFVLTLFIISWWIIRCHYADVTDFYTARGTFGDQFGAVNALFSALAFAGLIYTIILQMNELRYQREELIDNRNEMVRQTREFKQQNAALKKQTFENTFFNMLSLQQQIVNELSITEQQKIWLKSDTPEGTSSHEEMYDYTYTGRKVFEFLYIHNSNGKAEGLSQVLISGGLEAYEDAYYRTLLDHYFRHFYTILSFIDREGNMADEEKYHYAKILRATLSRYELVLLYYNGLSSLGNEKLKPLIEKYSILKNINPCLLILSHNSFGEILAQTYIEAVTSLKNAGFTGTDYELMLTDDINDINKYYYKAFKLSKAEFYQIKSLRVKSKQIFK